VDWRSGYFVGRVDWRSGVGAVWSEEGEAGSLELVQFRVRSELANNRKH